MKWITRFEIDLLENFSAEHEYQKLEELVGDEPAYIGLKEPYLSPSFQSAMEQLRAFIADNFSIQDVHAASHRRIRLRNWWPFTKKR